MPDRDAYHRQVQAARDVGLALSEAQLAAFLRLLEEYADELAVRVATALAGRGRAFALALAREMIEQLSRDMATATRNGIHLTARRVAEIYAEATMALIASAGTPVTVTLGGIGVQAAQAVLARPELAAAFRSIRRESVAAVDRILQRGLLRGATSDQLARELRLHVLGSEIFPARALLDRRRIGYQVLREMGYRDPTYAELLQVRKEAGQVAGRARLIARTEPMNAEHEARVRAAIDSPVVAGLRWRLSHRHVIADQCDVLAEVDWYGLGEGVYDPRRVPPRPHPRCLCYTLTVLRPVADWARSRGDAPRRRVDVEDVGLAYDLYPSQIASLAAAMEIADSGGRERQAA